MLRLKGYVYVTIVAQTLKECTSLYIVIRGLYVAMH